MLLANGSDGGDAATGYGGGASGGGVIGVFYAGTLTGNCTMMAGGGVGGAAAGRDGGRGGNGSTFMTQIDAAGDVAAPVLTINIPVNTTWTGDYNIS
ncbi:unnamed protein product, partial [marine sediment metagenome]